jgi:hypothetical protein
MRILPAAAIGLACFLAPSPAPAQSAGCDVTIYQHAQFAGAARRFTGDVPWVGDAWNDQVSSIVVSAGVWQFFQHARYEGSVMTLRPGSVGFVGDRWNDQISSFRCVQAGGAASNQKR